MLSTAEITPIRNGVYTPEHARIAAPKNGAIFLLFIFHMKCLLAYDGLLFNKPRKQPVTGGARVAENYLGFCFDLAAQHHLKPLLL